MFRIMSLKTLVPSLKGTFRKHLELLDNMIGEVNGSSVACSDQILVHHHWFLFVMCLTFVIGKRHFQIIETVTGMGTMVEHARLRHRFGRSTDRRDQYTCLQKLICCFENSPMLRFLPPIATRQQ